MMVALAGPEMRRAIGILLRMIQTCSIVPSHWLDLIIALVPKPSLPKHLLSSCRPVVLAEILSKALEKVLQTRLDRALSLHPLHPAIVAYRKGFSTGIALFTLIGASLHANLHNERHVIWVGDIAFAYNGTDRQRVEVFEWEYLKFRGQIWHLASQLARCSSIRVKFHGFLSSSFRQPDGYSQGKVLSGQHYNAGTHAFHRDIERIGGGVSVNGRMITGVCYSDDNFTLIRIPIIHNVLSGMQSSMGRLKMQAKAPKNYMLTTARNGRLLLDLPPVKDDTIPDDRKILDPDPDWFCSWKSVHPTLSFGGAKVNVRQSGKLLGRLVGPTVHRHAAQAEWAKRKGQKATKFLGWLGAYSQEASFDVAHLLCRYLVHSVIVSAVLNTQLTPADFTQLRVPQATVARRVSWCGARVSQLVILRELGWDPIDADIWLSKLALLETLKNLPAREYAKTVLDARMRTVQLGGDQKGLCFETKQLWDRAQLPGWDQTHDETRRARKLRLRPVVQANLELDWKAWCQSESNHNGDYALLCPPRGKAARHLAVGCKKRIGLMITMRAGACTFSGNKCGRDSHTLCACGHDREDGVHVLLDCPLYDLFRVPMMMRLESSWTFSQHAQFTSAHPKIQRLFLLGLGFGPDDNDAAALQARDLAVKDFLFAVNQYRKEALSLPDMCGKVAAPPAGSLQEALEWAEEAKTALGNLGDIFDDDDATPSDSDSEDEL